MLTILSQQAEEQQPKPQYLEHRDMFVDQPEDPFAENDEMQCVNCKRKFDEFSFMNILFLEQCCHIVCKLCFKSLVRSIYAKGHPLNCPMCKIPILEMEIKEHIGQQEFEDIQKQMLLSFVDKDESTVSCTCGAIVTIEEGRVDYAQKDDKGQPISKDAAENMSKYRIRCRNCARIFCTSCGADPYHLGKTCEEFKNFQVARKCRFCQNEIKNAGNKNAKPAFKDVCDQEECVDLMNKSCDKVLPCGHLCCGFRGEEQCLPCLNEECVDKNEALTLSENADSYCVICYVSALGEQPCVQLSCKHIFHVDCLMSRLEKKFAGPRITFLYATCTTCKMRVSAPTHPRISALMDEAN